VRITLDLDETKLGDLMRVLGVRSKTEAVRLAIDECLRGRRRSRLKALAGRVQIAENWRELRDLDR
jgi:hypothetical protein